MTGNRIVGLALLVGGLILLGFGLNASHAPLDRLSETFTGRFTDSTMLYLLAGAIVAVVGVGIMAFSGRRAS
jgi:hypothetical protein